MRPSSNVDLTEVLDWCASVLGHAEVVSDGSREHPGMRAGAFRLRTGAGFCYVKVHRDPAHWANEVHAYEQWATAFGGFAPRLLAVRDEEPLALVVTELPGRILEDTQLAEAEERAAWRSAGKALVALHQIASGDRFGPCGRDGTSTGTPVTDPRDYVAHELDGWLERGLRGAYLTDEDLATARAAQSLIPAFEGERPTPCHRDYCPANWLVTADGVWAGVIDFEFAYWDVRVADFTRYPGWEWMARPDLVEAFFEGYGRRLTASEEEQRLCSHTLYALGAIVWGRENAYYGFAAEGAQALKHLAGMLR